MKEIVGLIAVVLSFIALAPYIWDIFQNKTKPHLLTWIIWSIATVIVFLGQVVSGAGPGAWTTGVTAMLTILVTILAFRYGSKDVALSDKLFFVVALLAIVPWILTDDPTFSVIILTTIDVFAFFPTIRKTYNAPDSETLFTYSLNIVRHSLSIAALSTYALATYLFPLALLVMNIIVVSVILTRRKNARLR